MANQLSGLNSFFMRLGEMKHIGDTETVEFLDTGGNKFLTVELGVLGRDEEMIDGSGALLGKMQDKMKIGDMKGFRYRNLLDRKGSLVGTAMPVVPDPKPNERNYLLKDQNNKTVAVASTVPRQYPARIIIGSPDGSRIVGHMTKGISGTDEAVSQVVNRTSAYTVSIENNSVPELLFFEFLVSIFLFVLKE